MPVVVVPAGVIIAVYVVGYTLVFLGLILWALLEWLFWILKGILLFSWGLATGKFPLQLEGWEKQIPLRNKSFSVKDYRRTIDTFYDRVVKQR